MARDCSPKGVVKKHNLYNKQPKDWGQGMEGERGEGRGGEGRGGEESQREGKEGKGEGMGKGAGRGGELERDCTYHANRLLNSHHYPLPSFHPHPNVRLRGDLLSTVQIMWNWTSARH